MDKINHFANNSFLLNISVATMNGPIDSKWFLILSAVVKFSLCAGGLGNKSDLICVPVIGSRRESWSDEEPEFVIL